MSPETDRTVDGTARQHQSSQPPDTTDPDLLRQASIARRESEQVGESLAATVDYAPALLPERPALAGVRPSAPSRELASARSKLRRHGPGTLNTTDLLTVLLGPGTDEAIQGLLRRHGAAGLAKLDFNDLARSDGVGKGAAYRLAAALEFHRRLEAMNNRNSPKISKPAEVYAEVRRIATAKKEHLVGLYLDAQNGLLHSETLSVGSLNTTRTHPREILHPAIQCLALGFILAHNHPSGCLEPSPEDIEFTRAVRRAGEIMGIELYDHLIVTRAGYTSMRERGMLS